ncbi:hypothetical protein CapIbe_007283 [Capra ibex]
MKVLKLLDVSDVFGKDETVCPCGCCVQMLSLASNGKLNPLNSTGYIRQQTRINGLWGIEGKYGIKK